MIQTYIPKVIEALQLASEKIMEVYARDFDIELKADNSPVTEADKASNEILVSHLKQFNIPVISEEKKNPDYKDRKDEPLIWLVDPLDGTREFIKKNDQFCICIALIENGKPILGFIASPVDKKILFGAKATGVFEIPFYTTDVFSHKWKVKPPKNNLPKTLAHSNSPLSETSIKFVTQLEKKFGKIEYLKKGSALKFIDLAKGNADFYIRTAPTMEWDIAAGQIIYEILGGEVLNLNTKKELIYNKEKLKNPYFLAKLKTTKLD